VAFQTGLAVGVTTAIQDMRAIFLQIIIFKAQWALQVMIQVLQEGRVFTL
jgi:hypothetical protein